MKRMIQRTLAGLLAGLCTVSVLPAAASEQEFEPAQPESIVLESAAIPAMKEMYRLYNPNSGEHFYTAEINERDYLKTKGWNDEGVGWYAPANQGTPVYRLYNPNGGDHHYTMNTYERDGLVKAGWRDEGIGWQSMDANDLYAVPVYRQYNPNQFAANHNYTTSTREDGQLFEWGWNQEGVSWYGVFPYEIRVDSDGKTRIYDPKTGDPLNGWFSILGNNYYFDWRDNFAMATGETSAPSKETGMFDTFYFDEQGRQVYGFYQPAGERLKYIDRNTGTLARNKMFTAPSRSGSAKKALYDIDANGDVAEGRVNTNIFSLANFKASVEFIHPDSRKSIPMFDALKKGGISNTAIKLLNVGIQYESWPYLWGGRVPSQGGFDCSGLVTYCIREGLNKQVYATAETLWTQHVTPISESSAKSGDLVFWRGDFNGKKDYIYHTAIYLGGGWCYEASGSIVCFNSIHSHFGTIYFGRLK